MLTFGGARRHARRTAARSARWRRPRSAPALPRASISPDPAMSYLADCALPPAALAPPEPAIDKFELLDVERADVDSARPGDHTLEGIALDLVDTNVAGARNGCAVELRNGHREGRFPVMAPAEAEPVMVVLGMDEQLVALDFDHHVRSIILSGPCAATADCRAGAHVHVIRVRRPRSAGNCRPGNCGRPSRPPSLLRAQVQAWQPATAAELAAIAATALLRICLPPILYYSPQYST